MAVVHASGISKLYVNGVEVTYVMQSAGVGTMTTYPNTGFILGNGNSSGQKYFAGKMDNVMIFAKALTPAQIYALYKSQSGNMIDHDAAGNLVADKDGYLYDYDGENRIVRISRGDGDATPTTVAEFVYDALGRRIYAYDAIAGAGRYFCYNNPWQVLEEYNTARSFAWANVFGNYIDEVLVRSATSSKYYYAHNHLYSPVVVMDFTAGTVLERYDYDAYGTTHIMDAGYTARTASAVGNPYSFTGREQKSVRHDWPFL